VYIQLPFNLSGGGITSLTSNNKVPFSKELLNLKISVINALPEKQ